MRLSDIFPQHIREWITQMRRDGPVSLDHPVLQELDTQLDLHHRAQTTRSPICTHAAGVKIPTVPATPRTIITPEQFDAIYNSLPLADPKLLVETAIESGMRWAN
jgi:hypothetical protein